MKIKFNKKYLGMALTLIGVLFIFIGVKREEVLTVFNKAVKICMECIGIG